MDIYTEGVERISAIYEELIFKVYTLTGERLAKVPDSTIMGLAIGTASDRVKLRKLLEEATTAATAEAAALYKRLAADELKRLKRLAVAQGLQVAELSEQKRLLNTLIYTARVTGSGFENIARASTLERFYVQAVDKAVTSASLGIDSYNKALRDIINSAPRGARVTYASGATRRIDSAARMNLKEGYTRIRAAMYDEVGSRIGADGVEISVKQLCAPDHLPIQGRQFKKAEFDILQQTLERPIGELNCGHIALPIVMGVSKPTYSQEQLARIEQRANQRITYTDKKGQLKEATRYELSQAMRRLELNARKRKDQLALCNAAGQLEEAKLIKKKLKKEKVLYEKIAAAGGLTARPERMR